MMTKNRIPLLLALALALAAPAFADGPIVVESVSYQVDGRTMVYYLAQKANFPEGQIFPDQASLEAALEGLKKRLLNERVLETVEVAVEYGPAGEDGTTPARVSVHAVDTWNIIALPYFRYDSNTGLLLSVRARDYNFLGSMLPLRVNLNYEDDGGGNIAWVGDISFTFPFVAGGLDWNLNIDGSIGFQEGGANPMLGLSAGIGSAVGLGPGRLDFGYSQGLTVNARDGSGSNYADPYYLGSTLNLGWSVDVWKPLEGPAVSMRPWASLTGNWLFGEFSDPHPTTGPTLSSGTGFSYGSVDWVGNFREGFVSGLDLSSSYSLLTGENSRRISGNAALYGAHEWFGFSLRASAFYSFDGGTSFAAEALRGVLTSRASTDAAFVVNFDLPIRVIRFLPAAWFGKTWMRYFEFEQHWSPFIDMAQGHFDDSWFLVSHGWYTGGLEVITYPLAMRSLYIRISIGWNLLDVAQLRSLSGSSPRDGAGIYELFIGFGHHY